MKIINSNSVSGNTIGIETGIGIEIGEGDEIDDAAFELAVVAPAAACEVDVGAGAVADVAASLPCLGLNFFSSG